ncbi:GNAT family N-acetyltransferase [Candidatus Dactylopiibacterium carminicum]|nr:GNAT family N-acetyltransferase [Candidatus Dactylopiibacterium carminicum]
MILETPRLILRRHGVQDHPWLQHLFADPAVMRHAFAGHPFTEAETRAFLDAYGARPDEAHGIGVIVARDTGSLLGVAGLLPCDALGEDDVELGFVLATAAQGRGYAQEIGRAQIDHAFSAFGKSRVLALASPHNQASLKALERLGMQPFGEVESPQRGPRLVRVAFRPQAA